MAVLCFATALLCLIGALGHSSTGESRTAATLVAQTAPVSRKASKDRSLPFLRGVNFGGSQGLPLGNAKFFLYNQGYIYSPQQDYAYFAQKGMNFIRIPVVWERLQHTLQSPFDPDELARVDDAVGYARANHMFVAIDLHNFGRFDGTIIKEAVQLEALGRLWSMLAARYKSDDHVLFEPMNEPYGMATDDVQVLMQTAVDAIRAQGASNPILIDGNAFSGAHSWFEAGNTSLLQIKDPSDDLIFDTHQYLDTNSTGRFTDCVGPQQIVKSVTPITQWARTHRQRLLLGEFSAADTDDCHASIDALLSFVDGNKDVWSGWAWWEANPHDPTSPTHFYGIEPTIHETGAITKEVPQLAWLVAHLDE